MFFDPTGKGVALCAFPERDTQTAYATRTGGYGEYRETVECTFCSMQKVLHSPGEGQSMSTSVAPEFTNFDLEQRIRRLYDHLYANSSKRTPAGISFEVGKLLHTGQFLEEVKCQRPAFEFGKSELRELIHGDGSASSRVAELVHSTFEEMNIAWKLYPKSTSIELSRSDIAFVVAQLDGVLISDRTRDVFGDAVEIFRSQWAKREGGMFFTDQRVTHLSMTLLGFDPRNGDDLVDISSGTGGFLSAGLNRIRFLLEKDSPGADLEKQVVELAMKSIKGHEIDPDVASVANATLASRTGQTDHTFVHVGDSIAPESFGLICPSPLREGTHLCAASNPPFGTKTTIKENRVLCEYELARITNRGGQEVRNGGCYRRPPDILLLERNVRLLKQGAGRLAIVLPYQLLSGPQSQYVRDWLLRHVEIQAVIDLPSETFQPHTGTKTALVLVKRRKRTLEKANPAKNRKIFMALPKWIGHDRRGNPVYERSPDGAISSRILSDFDKVEEAYEAFLSGKDPKETYEQTFAIQEEAIYSDPLHRLNAMFHQPAQHQTLVSPRNKAWKSVKLNDVVQRVFYPGRFKRHYVEQMDGAVPFFGGSNITELIVDTKKWLSPENPRLNELRVQTGWLLVTRSGSTGIVSSVPPIWDGVAMSEHIIRIVPDNRKLPAEYIHAYLRTRQAQESLARGVFGSVIDEITPEAIGELEIPVPRSTTELDAIVKSMGKAEKARQVAIEGTYSVVDDLSSKISRLK